MIDTSYESARGGRTKRTLGSDSAENDRRFEEHFVSTSDFVRLATEPSPIVIGAKGSGKTAFMRGLASAYKTQFAHVYSIKLDELKFSPLFNAIKRLDSASQHGVVAIARAMWQNVIAVYLLEAAVTSKVVGPRDRTEIRKYLHRAGYLGTQATEKLSGHLERVWSVIANWTHDEDGTGARPLNSLSPRQHAAISAFPSDPKLAELLGRISDAVLTTGKPLLLCFDGLDSIVEHSLESRDTLFAGLIDASYKSVTDRSMHDVLALKVLLPKELAVGARRHLRDLDKIDTFIQLITWDKANLSEFMRKRLDDHVRIKGRPFNEVWHEYFPDKVTNYAHGIDEDSFHYILRHTLYRPRQLLLHVQWLLDKWDRREHAPFRLDPTFLRRTISEGNILLSEYVVAELRLDFPNLESFLRSFHGVSSIQSWQEVRDRMHRYLGVSDALLELAFTELFNYGLFGIRKHAVDAEARRTVKFQFAFMSRDSKANVVRRLEDRTEIALAPMLVDYCGCKPSLIGAVIPVE